MTNKELIKYDQDSEHPIEVQVDNETVWLTQDQLVKLFERDKSVISRHINNIFKEKELTKSATVAKYATVQIEGGREVTRNIDYYNLDMIISIGYRVNSKRGIQFRIWATKVLKEKLLEKYKINKLEAELKNTLNSIEKIVSGKGQININIGQNGTFLISNNTVGNIDSSFNGFIKTLEAIDNDEIQKDTEKIKQYILEKKPNKAVEILNSIKSKLVEIAGNKLAESSIEQIINMLG